MLRKYRKPLEFWLPVIAWGVLIFTLSSIPHPLDYSPSGFGIFLRTTCWLGIFLVDVFSFFVHYSLYLVLGILMVRALSAILPFSFTTYLIAFITSVVFGVCDELYQVSVPGRGFELIDLLANTLGVLTGLLFHYRWRVDGD